MPAASEPLLQLRDLRVDVCAPQGDVPILRGISLDLNHGEILGVVGESGSGKSVTWLSVLRMLGANMRQAGSVRFDGRDLSHLGDRAMAKIRGGQIGMIVQDATASLNPIHTIGFQMAEMLSVHQGMDSRTAKAEARRLLERVRVPAPDRRLTQYPHEMSGGTNQRIAIAMALAGQPRVLIADEPTTALDVTVQVQILDLLTELRQDTGMSIVLISHDLGVVRETSDRIAVMYAGRIVEIASSKGFWKEAQHPYTRGLMAAAPDLDEPIGPLRAIPGHVPAPHELPSGCAFRDRCPKATELCATSDQVLRPDFGGHRIACHLAMALPLVACQENLS